MNKIRIYKLLEDHLNVSEHEQNKVMIELLEALLDYDDGYEQSKRDFSIEENKNL